MDHPLHSESAQRAVLGSALLENGLMRGPLSGHAPVRIELADAIRELTAAIRALALSFEGEKAA